MTIQPPNIDVGWKSEMTVMITEKTVQQFAEMSGDFNPIHMDEEFASTTKFKRRIAHGMISGAFISRALNERIGAGGIYLAQTMKFAGPVFIDDTITIELEVTNLRKDRGIAIVSTNVKNQRGEFCVKGDATIMLVAPK
jgi:3-hydroxybutyryl-CoA dehydratase